MKNFKLKYLYEATVVFQKVDENIFTVYKDKEKFFSDKYVSAAKVIDTLNTVERVAIVDQYERNLFANFNIGEEGLA